MDIEGQFSPFQGLQFGGGSLGAIIITPSDDIIGYLTVGTYSEGDVYGYSGSGLVFPESFGSVSGDGAEYILDLLYSIDSAAEVYIVTSAPLTVEWLGQQYQSEELVPGIFAFYAAVDTTSWPTSGTYPFKILEAGEGTTGLPPYLFEVTAGASGSNVGYLFPSVGGVNAVVPLPGNFIMYFYKGASNGTLVFYDTTNIERLVDCTVWMDGIEYVKGFSQFKADQPTSTWYEPAFAPPFVNSQTHEVIIRKHEAFTINITAGQGGNLQGYEAGTLGSIISTDFPFIVLEILHFTTTGESWITVQGGEAARLKLQGLEVYVNNVRYTPSNYTVLDENTFEIGFAAGTGPTFPDPTTYVVRVQPNSVYGFYLTAGQSGTGLVGYDAGVYGTITSEPLPNTTLPLGILRRNSSNNSGEIWFPIAATSFLFDKQVYVDGTVYPFSSSWAVSGSYIRAQWNSGSPAPAFANSATYLVELKV